MFVSKKLNKRIFLLFFYVINAPKKSHKQSEKYKTHKNIWLF